MNHRAIEWNSVLYAFGHANTKVEVRASGHKGALPVRTAARDDHIKRPVCWFISEVSMKDIERLTAECNLSKFNESVHTRLRRRWNAITGKTYRISTR